MKKIYSNAKTKRAIKQRKHRERRADDELRKRRTHGERVRKYKSVAIANKKAEEHASMLERISSAIKERTQKLAQAFIPRKDHRIQDK